MSFENIECENCPGHKVCKNKQCDHCVKEREQEISSVDSIVALPYYYQDVCDKSLCIENESHLLRHVEASGNIHTKIQDTIVDLTRNSIPGTKFTLLIDNESIGEGIIKYSTISADNTRNEKARSIASQRTSNANTLWISDVNSEITSDKISMKLETDELETPLEFNVEFPPISSEIQPSKKLSHFAMKQIKQKGYNPNTHIALKANNIRFIIEKDTNMLKDVEIDMFYPKDSQFETIQYTCDPNNIDHVTGLLMALEECIQMGTVEDKNDATRLFNIINDHRIELEKSLIGNSMYESVPSINAAVHKATDMLWEAVGLDLNPGVRYHQRRMEQENKPGRNFGIEYAEKEVEDTLEKYQEVLTSKNKLKKSWIKRKLKNLQKAIKRREKSLKDGDLYERYYELETKLSNALEYGSF